jgi:acyl-CoA reductase-like NAD-dependent aldehyde dehydrogenase
MQGRLFIGGQWVDAASGATFATIDPATEERIGDVARAGAADVDRAVQAAHRALRGPWRELAPAERGTLLLRLADLVAGAREELARLETSDMGKPIGQARGDVDGVVATLVYNAGAADKIEGATIPLGPEVV